MDHHVRHPRSILYRAGRLQPLPRQFVSRRRRPVGNQHTPEKQRTERQRARRAAANPHGRNHLGGQPAPRRGGRPLVRDLGQDRLDQLPGRLDRPQGRIAGQSQRQTAAGTAVALRSAAQTGRRPCLPPERPARKGRRQPGSLRTGPHRTGDAQRRHRHRARSRSCTPRSTA